MTVKLSFAAIAAIAAMGGFPTVADDPHPSPPARKDPTDPVQAEKIRKAELKRERKGSQMAQEDDL